MTKMVDQATPLIRQFRISGLHGYKDITIDFESSVKIVIAENGAGKTTILTALDAFLRGDFMRLRGISFDSISCHLGGMRDSITLDKRSIAAPSQLSSNDTLKTLAQFSNVDETSLFSYITGEYNEHDASSFRRSPIPHSIYMNSPYDWDEIMDLFRDAKLHCESLMSEDAVEVSKLVKEQLKQYEVFFLPTYRRIEKAQPKRKVSELRRQFRSSSRTVRPKSYSTMNYGLEDVELRLAELSDEIQRRTNIGYREISAKIIDDLVLEQFDIEKSNLSDLPDLETLKRFFSRVGGSEARETDRIEKIKQLYSERGDTASPLRYFLAKLSQVVNQTSQLEASIELFVDKSNAYLSASSDEKRLTYDPNQMRVSVMSDWTGAEVKPDDLSSGEKQVVSLLAYLYLYPSDKIILIDEPELSLSIDWQQKILPDLASSPTCRQLFAITHSPFIFDNELDRFGGPLRITRVKKKDQSTDV